MAPEAGTRIRIEEQGERLRITIRQRVAWTRVIAAAGLAAFLYYGVSRFYVPIVRGFRWPPPRETALGTIAFLLFTLFLIWLVGGFVRAILRGLLGREAVTVDGQALTLAEGVTVARGGQRYDLRKVRSLRTAEVNAAAPRWAWRLVGEVRSPTVLFDYDDHTVTFGSTLFPEEAQRIVAAILPRLTSGSPPAPPAAATGGESAPAEEAELRAIVRDEADALSIAIPVVRDREAFTFMTIWVCSWLLIMGGLLFTVFSRGYRGPADAARAALALGLWSAAGVGAIYSWLWLLSGREAVRVSHGRLTLRANAGLLPRVGRFAVPDVRGVGLSETYRRKRRGRLLGAGTIVVEVRGKTYVLGASLGDAEAKRLVKLLRTRLGLPSEGGHRT